MTKTKTYEGYGRLGLDWSSGSPFFGEAPSSNDVARMLLRELEGDYKEIHEQTCNIKQFDTKSKTGDFYLAEKCIKYKIEVSVEAELVDDEEVV